MTYSQDSLSSLSCTERTPELPSWLRTVHAKLVHGTNSMTWAIKVVQTYARALRSGQAQETTRFLANAVQVGANQNRPTARVLNACGTGVSSLNKIRQLTPHMRFSSIAASPTRAGHGASSDKPTVVAAHSCLSPGKSSPATVPRSLCWARGRHTQGVVSASVTFKRDAGD